LKTTAVLAAASLAALSVSACASGLPTGGAPAGAGSEATVPALPPASLASAVPDAAGAAKAAAVEYLTLYSAGQWQAAWRLLAPQDQRLAPEAVYAAFHRQCPPEAAGMAYKVEGVMLAGRSGAVVTYTVPVMEKVYGSATNPMEWTPGGWRVEFDAAAIAQYSHGGLEADVKAAKKAGDCAGG
jgi:hypothetical protein